GTPAREGLRVDAQRRGLGGRLAGRVEVDFRAERGARGAGRDDRAGHLQRGARESVSDLQAQWSQLAASEPDEHRRAAWQLADELRRIVELLTLVDAPTAELANAAEAAHTFADRLDDLLPKRT